MSARTLALCGAVLLGGMALAYSQLPKVWVARAERVARPQGLEFTGALPTYADDCFTYWSWIRQARTDQRFFFEDLYTTEEHPRNYVNVLFWALGTIARWTGSGPERTYSVVRILLSVLLLVLLWRLAGRLFEAPFLRLTAFGFFVVQGGWAGVADVFERHWRTAHVSSPEWWTPEMNTVFSMMLFPHFLAGFCCVVGIALLTLSAYRAETRARGIPLAAGSGLVMTLLTFFHPYDVVAPTVALWIAPPIIGVVERRFPRREAETAIVATAVWLPSLLYNAWIFTHNPAMRAWDLQNEMITPEPSRLIISLGIGGALAAAALLSVRQMSTPLLFMASWFVSHLVLIHLPFRFQRRMIGGIQFPMGALAAFALAAIISPPLVAWLARSGRAVRWRRALGPAPLGAAVLAIACVVFPFESAGPRRIVHLEWGALRAAKYPAWVRHTEVDMFARLEREHRECVVFCSYEMGGLVPPWTGHRTYLGHYALTIEAKRKEDEVRRFYSAGAEDDAWRRGLLASMRATHVLWTAHERALGEFDPSTRPWLREVFRAGDGEGRAVIYAVLTDDGR